MPNAKPLKLNIRDKKLREEIEAAILREMRESISGAQDRNDDLQEMDDQMQMITGVSGNEPWRDSATLADTMTFDQSLTIAAMLSAAMSRELKALVEAVQQKDEKSAQSLEYYVAHKHYEAGYDKVADHLIYNVTRWPFAILYDGWKEVREDVRFVGHVPVDEPDTLPIEEQYKQEGIEYDEVPMMRPGDVVYKGLEMRVVDSTEFYMYPPDSISIESATACGEMQLLSKHVLLDSIEQLELDEDKVYKLLARGGGTGRTPGSGDYRETLNDRDGVQQSEDWYEVVIWYTRMPLIFDPNGELRTPKHLLNDTFLCIGIPSLNIMLRMDFSPDGKRIPYIKHCMLEIPNAFQGWCIPKILDALQAEANAEIQMGINVMNFELQPMIKAPQSEAQYYQNFQARPGGILWYRRSADEIQPFTMPSTLRGNQETLVMLGNKAEKLISAGGFGSYQPKQRKNVETQAVQQAAFTKFDHYLKNFQRGVEETHRHSAALLAEHMDDDGETFLDPFDNPRQITPQDLKSKYIFKTTASSTNTDPATRIEMGRELAEVVAGYWAVHDQKNEQGQPANSPDAIKAIWHTSREIILAMGKHSVETYIGEEPQAAPQQAQPQPLGMELTPMQPPIGAGNGTGAGPQPVGLGNTG